MSIILCILIRKFFFLHAYIKHILFDICIFSNSDTIEIKMLGNKRSQEVYTSKPTEKIPAIKNFGVMLYDIPLAIALENLKKISRSENFIPKYKTNNMRIAFFICESKKERENIYKSASGLNPLIKWTDFKPWQSLIKIAILSLKSISNFY